MNTNKNWGDRADKDLFFTILSVKQIGVISGGEWTTIGNHMRQLGYGFTNEGCRQHFQGLRRAQNKAESTGLASNANARNNDPTQNPITRRPGPGRGRPRKAPVANPANPANPAPVPHAAMGAGAAPVAPMGPGAPVPIPIPGVVSGMAPSNPPALPNVAGVPNIPAQHGDASSMADAHSIQDADGESPQPRMTGDGSLSGHGDTPLGDDLAAVDPSLEDADEHLAKRPRLHENHDPSLDDDVAVMNALTAHNNPGGGMGFHPEYFDQA
ncbi:hypothetical protein QBC39DRAFT_370748 [Podospora conica]|nr:hypothetical protein QBC39DRAFT_370748 [Schizothecium conicum]